MCNAIVEEVRQDGSADGSWGTTTKLRRVQGVVLIAFLGLQQGAIHPGSLRVWPREVEAVLAGACFFTLLAIGCTLAMRCGNEQRRVLLQRSVWIGVAITMGLACVGGYWEVAMGAPFHVPLLAVPACLVAATAMAKVVLFRRQWFGLGSAAR